MGDLNLAYFLDWEGKYGKFVIKNGKLPNGCPMTTIIVAHEGNWLEEDAMICHSEYDKYEDVQADKGIGLDFIDKEFSSEKRMSYYKFALRDNSNAILEVPATGEEIRFEIFGEDLKGERFLIYKGEL